MSQEEDAADRLRRRVLWKLPTGLYLLGSISADGERRNLMTLNQAIQVASAPKLVAVSVESTAYSCELINESQVFALSILRRDDRNLVRKFVKPVDPADVDIDGSGKGTMREVAVRSDRTGAPITAGAAAWLDCAVKQAVPLGSHSLFVGEVVGFGFSDGGEESEVLRMEDTRMNYGG
jgi:flavin reductase (DIM6/NTAB) family NADH-FMN oxidoreductase RutF